MDTGLGETTTKEANAAVERVLQEQSQPTGKFTPRSAMSREQLLGATLQNTATLLLLRSSLLIFVQHTINFCKVLSLIYSCVWFESDLGLDQKRINKNRIKFAEPQNWPKRIILYPHKFLALRYL